MQWCVWRRRAFTAGGAVPEQVYVATVSHGPQGGSLNATYRNSEQLSFQDELGETVLGVCAAVPNGVLCFFPSYSMLDKLVRRWVVCRCREPCSVSTGSGGLWRVPGGVWVNIQCHQKCVKTAALQLMR